MPRIVRYEEELDEDCGKVKKGGVVFVYVYYMHLFDEKQVP